MGRNLLKAAFVLAAALCQSNVAVASASLFNATLNGTVLSVTTNIPNHVYPAAGIKVNTPGFEVNPANQFTHTVPASTCTALNNGFCRFTASNTTPTLLVIYDTTSPGAIKKRAGTTSVPVSITLCLNANGPLSCQTQIFDYIDSI